MKVSWKRQHLNGDLSHGQPFYKQMFKGKIIKYNVSNRGRSAGQQCRRAICEDWQFSAALKSPVWMKHK